MSMRHYPAFADTVSDEFVREICPDEVDALQVALDKADYNFDLLGMSNSRGSDLEGELSVDMDDDHNKTICDAIDKLYLVFEERTGLTLDIDYHSEEDDGDEISEGFYWIVGGVYELTEAGKKYQKEIKKEWWVTFG